MSEQNSRWLHLEEAGEKLVYDESVRAVDHQGRAVEALRTRAITVLAAGSIATGFLAPQALKPDAIPASATPAFTVLDWLATTSFCGLLILTLAALLLRSGTFAHGPHRMITELLDDKNEALPLALLYRHFSYWNGVYFTSNKKRLEILYTLTVVSSVLLVTEVLAWILEIR